MFAGAELLGVMNVNVRHENGQHVTEYGPLKIKPEDGRCNGCGSCCSSSGVSEKLLNEMSDALINWNTESEACPFQTDTGCLMRGWIPFSCAKSLCTDYDGCTEKLVEAPL